jgi:flagellar biosynthesis/type III secretory pathway M-ring protein FliF/YscJ
MPFTSTIEVAESAATAVPAVRNGELMSFIQIIAFGAVGLTIIVLTARSIYTSLSRAPATIAVVDGVPGPGEAGFIYGSPGGGAPGIEGAAGEGRALLADGTTSLVDNVETQARQSIQRKVKELVEKHPAEAVAILRAWMAEDNAGR